MADQNFKVKNGITFTPVDLTTLTNAAAGDIAVDINDSNKLKRYNSVTSAWVEVGSASSGVGDLNTLQADTAETNTLADYTQTGLEILTTVGGATANQLIHGTATYRLIHQAASTYSFKRVIAVDEKFRNRALTITIWNRSTATSGNDTLLVTDETNATTLLASSSIQTDSAAFSVTTVSASPTITMATNSDYNSVTQGCSITGPGIPTGSIITAKGANNQITISNNATAGATVTARVSGLPTARTFSFTTGATTASLSWTISSLQEANLPESYFDDIQISIAQTAQTSAAITTTVFNATPDAQVTITPSAGFGTTTLQTTFMGRSGDKAKFRGQFKAGTVAGTTAVIGLPAGMSIDASKFATTASTQPVGWWQQVYGLSNTSIAAPGRGPIFFDGTDTSNLYCAYQYGSNAFTKSNCTLINSSEYFEYTFEVPILGWTANTTTTQNIPLTSSVLVTEPDSALVLITGSATGATVTNFLVGSIRGSGFRYDAPTGKVYALKEGLVTVTTQGVCGASSAANLSIRVNGVTVDSTEQPQNNLGGYKIGTSWSGYLSVNDYITVVNTQSAAVSTIGAQFSMVGKTKILNPSSDQKIAIPTHELRFESSTTRGSTDTQVVKFDNMTKIIGDGLTFINTSANGTVVTAQKAGLLSVSTGLYAGPGSAAMQITRNSASLVTFGVSSGEVIGYGGHVGSNAGGATCSSIPVVKGDVIRVMLNVVPVANGTANFVEFTLTESSVAVALSNVTPQFVDGGSFLELQQANGFGSTATSVRRFSTLLNSLNNGQDFTYVDSSTLGAQITIKTPDFYSITFCDSGSGPTDVYVMVNSIPRAISTTASASYRAEAVFSGYLNANDVVTFVNSAQTTGTTSAQTRMTIARIGKPSLAAVDVTPFVNLVTTPGDIGELTEFATPTVAPDYLLCDGTAISRSTYSDLFNALGTSHGQGDGSTTFNVPDYRGRFLRGVDGSAGRDSDKLTRTAMNTGGNTGNNVGSVQADAFQGHRHSVGSGIGGTNTGGVQFAGNTAQQSSDPTTDGTNGTPRTSAETRPTNAYVTIGIRWRVANKSIISAAKTYRMSDYLATGTRVTGVAPANLGEYRTFTRGASGLVYTDNAPTVTPSVANGIAIYKGNNFANADTNGNPTRVDIFVGKNKSIGWNFYSTTGRTGALSVDMSSFGSTLVGCNTTYDPTTGIASIINPTNGSVNLQAGVGFDNTSNVISNGYFDVTVFESPFVSVALPAPVNASMFFTTGGTYLNGSTNTVLYNIVEYDTHGGYNPATGLYTCKVAGKYRVSSCHAAGGANPEQVHQVYKNGAFYKELGDRGPVNGQLVTSGSCLVKMAVGDTISIVMAYSGGGGNSTNLTTQGINFFDLNKID